ncbi:GumC family protein [Candidatus Nitrospira salsa]|nr:MAG: LPS biosynthesis protein [Nitrospirales bacterium]
MNSQSEQQVVTNQPAMPQVSIRDILTIFFKHKRKILGVFLGTVTLVTLGSFLLPPTYEASSSLMVKMGREHIYRPEVGSVNPSVSFDQERVIESELQIILSRDLMEQVINAIGIERMYPDIFDSPPSDISMLEASFIEMQDNFRATGVKDSNVINLSFQHTDPEVSAQSINLLVELLLEKHLEIFSNPQFNFLEKQVRDYQDRLNTEKIALQDFKRLHGLSSLEEERHLLLEQRRDLDVSHRKIKNERDGLKSKLESLEKQISDIPAVISSTSISERQKVIDEAKSNLLKLQLEEQNLSTRYKDTSRFLINIRSEIQMIEKFIHDQESILTDRVTTERNPVYQELSIEIHKAKSELRSLESQADAITLQLKELDANLSKLDTLAKELEELQLQVESAEKNYTMYLSKVEDARVAEEMDHLKLANISVIQSAVVPAEPIRPKKALNVLIAIILGGAAGICLALLSEYFQGGYTRSEQASHALGLPTLTSVRYYHDLP